MAILDEKVSNQVPFNPFEHFLSDSLGEVKPDPEFVGQLRRRLAKQHEVELEYPRLFTAYAVLGVGLFSGVLLFWILSQLFKGVKTFFLH